TKPKPMIIESVVDGQGIELLHRRVGIKIIREFAWTIDGLEKDAQTMFEHQVAARAALDANPAVKIESLLSIRPHVFQRTRPFGRLPGRIGIGPDAGWPEHVLPRQGDTQGRDAEQAALEGVAV